MPGRPIRRALEAQSKALAATKDSPDHPRLLAALAIDLQTLAEPYYPAAGHELRVYTREDLRKRAGLVGVRTVFG